MSTMFPLEIIQLISNSSCVRTKFNILVTCKDINNNGWINTFYDKLYLENGSIHESPNISHKITQRVTRTSRVDWFNIGKT